MEWSQSKNIVFKWKHNKNPYILVHVVILWPATSTWTLIYFISFVLHFFFPTKWLSLLLILIRVGWNSDAMDINISKNWQNERHQQWTRLNIYNLYGVTFISILKTWKKGQQTNLLFGAHSISVRITLWILKFC